MFKSLTTELTQPLVSPLSKDEERAGASKRNVFEPLVQDESVRERAKQGRYVEADTEL